MNTIKFKIKYENDEMFRIRIISELRGFQILIFTDY